MKSTRIVRSTITISLIVIFSASLSIAQIPKGYKGIDWASGLGQVIEKYHNLVKSNENVEDDYFIGMTYYVAKANSTSVSKRWFGFWNRKLTKVIVNYKTSVDPIKLTNMLIEAYGKNASADSPDLLHMKAIWHGNGETDVFLSVTFPNKQTPNYKNESLSIHFTSAKVKAEYDKIKSEEGPIEF